MGKISADDEKNIRELIEKERPQIALLYPELASRPREMRKLVEAIDALIASWLAAMPSDSDELRYFFARQISAAFNFYSQYVCAEFKELCGYLGERFKNGQFEIIEVNDNGKKVAIESHMLDTIIFRRNFFAAYLGDELKCFDDYLSKEPPVSGAS